MEQSEAKITFHCHHCDARIELDNEAGHDRTKCPSCSEIVFVPPAGIQIGKEIAGYRITGHLGSGGMGEVYSATQTSMDRQVALKILAPGLTSNEEEVKRFLNEVRMAAKLEHPNVVTSFDAGKARGYYYLAMSFIDGEDLDHRLKREKRLPEIEALEIVDKVAAALEHAWDKFHMLHRDLKPANVMIGRDGDVKLMDMGIAKSLEEDKKLTKHGMMVGTPHYVSPEQAAALTDIDCRSDIYALGATLYHLVCGRPPFDGANAVAVITKHVTETPMAPRMLNSTLSEETENLILRMMACDREERFTNWDECRESLAAILLGSGATVTAPAYKELVKQKKILSAMMSRSSAKAPKLSTRQAILMTVLLLLTVLSGMTVMNHLKANGMKPQVPQYGLALEPPKEKKRLLPRQQMAPKASSQSETLIEEVHVACSKDGEYQIDTLEVGKRVFVDRKDLWSEVPEGFQGMTVIRPLGGHGMLDNRMTFRLTKPAAVYLAYPDSVKFPPWLREWERVRGSPTYKHKDEFMKFKVLRKSFPAGIVQIAKFRSSRGHLLFAATKPMQPLSRVMPTVEPLFKDIIVNCGEGRKYRIGYLEERRRAYIDQRYHWIKIPAEYRGHHLIYPINAHNRQDNHMSFTLVKPAMVYLAHLPQEDPPAWLQSWEETGQTITLKTKNHDMPFNVRRKDFPAGKVEVGRLTAQYHHVVFAAQEQINRNQAEPLIKDLFVTCGKTGEYQLDTLKVGKKVYGDREFAWRMIPEEFEGLTVIQPQEDHKQIDNRISFTLTQPGVIYLAHPLGTSIPSWLQAWDPVEKEMSYERSQSTSKFLIRCKPFPAGEVEIGAIAAPNTHIIFAAKSMVEQVHIQQHEQAQQKLSK